jgi:hypothetical protein
MKIAIMQPYFMPYIGYFQLINSVDKFILYDDIQYTKKGWINRNRILLNGSDNYISLPLKKDSDFLNIKDRYLAKTWPKERIKILNKIKASYKKSPYFQDTFPIIESIILVNNYNLFDFLHNSIVTIAKHININTNIIISSTLTIEPLLKAENKVIAICQELDATNYINPIGGTELYDKDNFANKNIKLNFLQSSLLPYKQFAHDFIPGLSIIDILMFNSKENITRALNTGFKLK